MFYDATKVLHIASLTRYERAVLDHLDIRDTEKTAAWCRRLAVLASQVACNEAAPALRPSSGPVTLRVEAAVSLAQWLAATKMWTQADIAAYLNDQGERTARGRLWSQGNLNRYLNGWASHR